MAAGVSALFYPLSLGTHALEQLVLGIAVLVDPDLVDFPAEDGGTVERELAVPFRAGMDAIAVEQAVIAFTVAEKSLAVSDFSVHPAAGDQGVVLALARPARLRKITLTYALPEQPAGTKRVVLRPAQPSGGGFASGPPLLAAPDFPPPGPMYGRVLSGLGLTEAGGDRRVLSLSGLAGQAWHIQLASGEDPAGLSPLAVVPTIEEVVVDGLPLDLAVTLEQTGGQPGDPLPLWSHPGVLLPGSGEQVVSFTPLAERALAAALPSASGPTLPLRLRLSSKSACALRMTRTVLDAVYRVSPLPARPTLLRLEGSSAALPLGAPAMRRAGEGRQRIAIRHLGHALNAGSPPPGSRPGAQGVTIDTARQAARRLAVLPPTGQQEPAIVALVLARACLAAREDAEIALELHEDAAGLPGRMLGAPVVRQLGKGPPDWVGFALAEPLEITPRSSVWLVLRATKGRLFWFAAPAGQAGEDSATCISRDKGGSWAAPDAALDAALGPSGAPLAQLFHALPPPQPQPSLALLRGESVLSADLLADAARTGPSAFLLDGAVPSAWLDALAAAPGSGRVETLFHLASADALEITFQDLTLSYAPGGAP